MRYHHKCMKDGELPYLAEEEKVQFVIELMGQMGLVKANEWEEGDTWGYLNLFMEGLQKVGRVDKAEMVKALKTLFNAMRIKLENGEVIEINSQLDKDLKEAIDTIQGWCLDLIGFGDGDDSQGGDNRLA